MARKLLTHGTKRDIHQSLDRRESQLNERLRHISEGRSHPASWNKRLNEPKRYEVAAVFIDIDRFQSYLIDNGTEATFYMLGLFIPEAMRVITEYDGYFEKNTGDGLLAYFGFEKSPAESVADVLQYITTIRWVISKEINPRLNRLDIEPMSASSGTTYGTVHLANIGTRSLKQDLTRLTAVSPQVNTAFMLENKASHDEHLVGPGIQHYAEEDDQQYLQLYDLFDEYSWTNPETDQTHPYMIHQYTGEWLDETTPFEEINE